MTMLPISRAAQFIGLSHKTLLRAEKDSRITFLRSKRGHRYIAKADLLEFPLFTLGRAAKRLKVSEGALRRAARRGRLRVVRRMRRVVSGVIRWGYLHASWGDLVRLVRAMRAGQSTSRWTRRP